MPRSWYVIRYYEDGAEYYYCGSFSLSEIYEAVDEVFRNYPKVELLKIYKNDCYYKAIYKEDYNEVVS